MTWKKCFKIGFSWFVFFYFYELLRDSAVIGPAVVPVADTLGWGFVGMPEHGNSLT